jgi:hypothetical protein
MAYFFIICQTNWNFRREQVPLKIAKLTN